MLEVKGFFCDFLECFEAVEVVSGVELVLEVPAVGFELGEVVDDRVEVGQHEGQLLVVGVAEIDAALDAQVPDLVVEAHRLLNQVLVAVVGDLLVETLELGGNQHQSEVLVGRTDLELLQHLRQKGHEVL